MGKVLIIQHCQSEHHINEMSGGWTDTPLTDLGRKQANLIGERLKEEIDPEEYVLYSSDLLRASQTAEIVAKHLNLNVRIDRDLREINTGVAAGKTKEWARQNRNPRTSDGFNLDYREWQEGESWREFNTRIYNCMERLWNSRDKHLILVTHGCTLNNIIAWWMKFETNMLEKAYFTATAGSISLLIENPANKQNALRSLNDTAHLNEYN